MIEKDKNKKLIEKIDKLGDDAIKSKQNSNLIVDLLKHASVSWLWFKSGYFLFKLIFEFF